MPFDTQTMPEAEISTPGGSGFSSSTQPEGLAHKTMAAMSRGFIVGEAGPVLASGPAPFDRREKGVRLTAGYLFVTPPGAG